MACGSLGIGWGFTCAKRLISHAKTTRRSPNLLVDESWRVRVADFNVSKIMEGAVDVSSPAVTNPRWLAPEVLLGEPATKQSVRSRQQLTGLNLG